MEATPKTYAIIGVLVAMFLSGFVIQRYIHRPEEHVTNDVQKTEDTKKTTTNEKTTTDVKQAVRRTITKRKRPSLPPTVKVPEGCPTCPPIDEEITEEEIVTDATQKKDAQTVTDETSKTEKKHEESETRKKPDWRVSALAGIDTKDLSIVYGAEVERRIIGPVWGGVWAIPQERIGGVKLSVEF